MKVYGSNLSAVTNEVSEISPRDHLSPGCFRLFLSQSQASRQPFSSPIGPRQEEWLWGEEIGIGPLIKQPPRGERF